jgi:hypothetical protein
MAEITAKLFRVELSVFNLTEEQSFVVMNSVKNLIGSEFDFDVKKKQQRIVSPVKKEKDSVPYEVDILRQIEESIVPSNSCSIEGINIFQESNSIAELDKKYLVLKARDLWSKLGITSAKSILFSGFLGKTIYLVSNMMTSSEYDSFLSSLNISNYRAKQLIKLQNLLETFPRIYQCSLDVSFILLHSSKLKKFLSDSDDAMKIHFRTLKFEIGLCEFCGGCVINGTCELGCK